MTESSAFPKEAYPNVIVYLPPGPIFQPSGGHGNENGNGAVVNASHNEGDIHPYPSLTRNAIDHFRTQHDIAEATASTVITIHYRLGTLEPPEEEEEQVLVNEGVIINPTSQFEKGPRLVYYKYPTPIHDTLLAFDWIQETFQPTQTSILGTHIGGSIALMLALTESESVHAVAALEPICDWTGLDAYCTVPEEGQEQDQGQGQEQKEPEIDPESDSPGTSPKSRSIKKKKPQSPAPPDLPSLLQARESLFSKPSQYFDIFASPLLFLRSPGKPVPATFPKYLTGPEYPIPVLKPRPAPPVPRDDDILDLWDAVYMPDTEQWIDDDGVVHDHSSDSDAGDNSNSSSPTLSTASTTSTLESYTPRYRKSLSRWPPHGLDWGLSGTTRFRPRFNKPQRPQVTLPWVRIFIRGDSDADNTKANTSSDQDAPPRSKRGSPKKKSKNEKTVISHQATDMVDVMRRACFWGRERGISERGVVLERVGGEGESEGDDGMWYVTAEEKAGRWLFEVRGEPR